MKQLVNFLLLTQIILCFGFCLVFIRYSGQDYTGQDYSQQLAGLFSEENSTRNGDSLKRMPVYDVGLQMVRGSYLIPHDWLLYSSVYTDPYSNDFLQNFTVSFIGPHGEIIHSQLVNIAVDQNTGTREELFRQEILDSIQKELNSLLGQSSVDTTLSNQITQATYLNSLTKIDSGYHYMETTVTGKEHGEEYDGLVRVVYPNIIANQHAPVWLYIILSPDQMLDQTLKIENDIAFSYQPNLAYDYYVSRNHRYDKYQ